MFHIKLFLRQLRKNATFSFVTIVGFSLSLSALLLIYVYVSHEYSYDKSFSKVDRIYKIEKKSGSIYLNEKLKDYLDEQIDEIESVCRFENITERQILSIGDKTFHIKNILQVDSSIFDFFETDFVKGNKVLAFNSIQNIILSESKSNELFGDEDPLNKILEIENREFLVAGVMKDFPMNSSLQPEAIIHREAKLSANMNCQISDDQVMDCIRNSYFFVMAKPGTSVATITPSLNKIFKEHVFGDQLLTLRPLKESYFSTTYDDRLQHANIKLIQILQAIGVLILVISILNFVILFSAYLINRMKEIGLRNIFGLSHRKSFLLFILEAQLIVFFSFGLSLILAELFLPMFEQMVNKSIPLNILYQFHVLTSIIFCVMIVGFLSAIVPALIYSKIRFITVKEMSIRVNRLRIKSGLSIVQYTISITLLICLIVVEKQLNFVKTKDFGFDKEHLIKINRAYSVDNKNYIQAISSHHNVLRACSSGGLPGEVHGGMSWKELQDTGYEGTIPTFNITEDFFKVFDVKFIHGRMPRENENGCVVNAMFMELFELQRIEGESVNGHPILGVVEDFHFENLYQKIKPTFFQMDSKSANAFITVRFGSAHIPETLDYLRNTWKTMFPDAVFDYVFYDEWLDSMYQAEEKLAYTIRFFAILAILISAMGTFAVAKYISFQRTKEIGIRKVNGASVKDILVLINHKFAVWMAVAFVVSCPVAYYFMQTWLENFAYATEISWWVFLLAGLITISISALTVIWQSWSAARRNPVEALRNE